MLKMNSRRGLLFTFVTALTATTLMLGTAGQAHAGLISQTNTTNGNFDNSSDTRTFIFDGFESGFGSGIISDVNIGINFAKADGEDFNPPYPTDTPYFNEIVFRLTSPTGTIVDLINENSFNGGSGPGFVGRIDFDQQATQAVNVNPNRPQAGFFRPVGDLNAFNGQNALGTWTLFIEDTVGADSLRFYDAQLNVQTAVAPVPELSSGMLFALALMGMSVLAWRRKGGQGVSGSTAFRF